MIARTYVIRGRVQGVGFRYFAEQAARGMGVRGTVRNLPDGGVEVFAMGTEQQLSDFSALLWKGPRFADVRGVEVQEAALRTLNGFYIER